MRASYDRRAAANERGQAELDRDSAMADRTAGAAERGQSEHDRDIALADRAAGTSERGESGLDRDTALADRAAGASERGQAGLDRDTALADRTAGASERGQAGLDRDTALADRTAGASERDESGLDRDTALADREAGASERGKAGQDRDTALADRGASASDRKVASVDSLTGAYLRGAGVAELARDIARARRSDEALVVAFIDVDHLKTINDVRGHAAGDRMLLEVAQTLRDKLRSYDLIIRYGGDEFICAISGLNLAEATERLALVNTVLAHRPEHGSVTLGLAELGPEDSLESLVARADAELYRVRQTQRQTPLHA
jgi:diguanylate cyclase (GGDEF)-like protein